MIDTKFNNSISFVPRFDTWDSLDNGTNGIHHHQNDNHAEISFLGKKRTLNDVGHRLTFSSSVHSIVSDPSGGRMLNC